MAQQEHIDANEWEQARERLAGLERGLDPDTIRQLEQVGISAGWQCLEVGGGAGSIAEWMCRRVGPDGRVVATDVDTRFLETINSANIEVRNHNIVTDDLEIGFYDLAHARYVLIHLKEWESVLGKLADSLKPGGWLVLEDPDSDGLMCDAAASKEDQNTMNRIFDAFKQLTSQMGMDMKFGSNTLKAFQDYGLESLQSVGISHAVFGGSPWGESFRLSINERKDYLVSSGLVTGDDVSQFVERANQPTYVYRSMTTVFTLGRKPA